MRGRGVSARIRRMSARRLHYSYAQYVALEEESSIRHEYLDGEIYAMAGGTPGHAGLAAATIALLGRQLQPGCRVYTSDLRVRISATGLTTYRMCPSFAVQRNVRPTTGSPR
jgi:Uma2 family endonuclease